MLSTAQRLRRRGEFAATVRGGRRASRGALVVHLMLPDPATEPGASRAGFVVPKAVGGAVQRNTVKRRLRHLVRERIDALPPGSDLVVRAHPAARDRPYRVLGADLDAALASVLRKASR